METKKRKVMIYFIASLLGLFVCLASDGVLLILLAVANAWNSLRLMKTYFPEQFKEQE